MSTPHEPGAQLQPEGAQETTAAASAKAAAHTRRAFLFKMSLYLNGAVGAVLAVPILGYILGPALRKNSSYNAWVSLGPISDFPEGETRLVDYRNPVTTVSDGVTGNVACWVRRIEGKKFQVFAINCAHLGCPVRWFAQSKLFLCPCHGGAYYEDGARASGPPERGLFEYEYTIAGNNLMIHAGEMPTLATQACVKKPLVQIEAQPGSTSEEAEERSSSWPA
ncbi:MAG: Rieske (2Fe-2S) protein [Terracidiphilus sp.]|jgi:menaquinol-cytochrome c reductase iron-sulfur subunit